jgi:hypothetical protein
MKFSKRRFSFKSPTVAVVIETLLLSSGHHSARGSGLLVRNFCNSLELRSNELSRELGDMNVLNSGGSSADHCETFEVKDHLLVEFTTP